MVVTGSGAPEPTHSTGCPWLHLGRAAENSYCTHGPEKSSDRHYLQMKMGFAPFSWVGCAVSQHQFGCQLL